MSWSIAIIGTTSNIVEALEKAGEKMDEVSRTEYEASKPSLISLVQQNFDKNAVRNVKVQASGHGFTNNNEVMERQVSVLIEPYWGQIV